MNLDDKDLGKKIEVLLSKKKQKDEIEHYLDVFRAVDGYLKEVEKQEKQCFFKKGKAFVNKDYYGNTNTKTAQLLNFYATCNEKLTLGLRIDCKEITDALRYYYKAKIAEHIEQNEKRKESLADLY